MVLPFTTDGYSISGYTDSDLGKLSRQDMELLSASTGRTFLAREETAFLP